MKMHKIQTWIALIRGSKFKATRKLLQRTIAQNFTYGSLYKAPHSSLKNIAFTHSRFWGVRLQDQLFIIILFTRPIIHNKGNHSGVLAKLSTHKRAKLPKQSIYL